MRISRSGGATQGSPNHSELSQELEQVRAAVTQSNRTVGSSAMQPVALSPVSADHCEGNEQNIRHMLNPQDVHTIKDIFSSFDKNQSGVIDAAELKRAFPRDAPMIKTRAHGEINLDQDSSGDILPEEWLDYFAAVKHEKCRVANDPEAWTHFLNYIGINSSLSDRQLYHFTEIFNMYDTNNDGVLSESEMTGLRLCHPKAQKKFDESSNPISKSTEQDGGLTYEKFTTWCEGRRQDRGMEDMDQLINALWGYDICAITKTELEDLETVFKRLCTPPRLIIPVTPRQDGQQDCPLVIALSVLALAPIEEEQVKGVACVEYSKSQFLQRASKIKLEGGEEKLTECLENWKRIEKPQPRVKARCCAPGADSDGSCVVA